MSPSRAPAPAPTLPLQPSSFRPHPSSSASFPTDRDRLIFHWVKFDGHTQAWVAQQLDVHQSTVSRTVQRYERWLAQGGPEQDGALTPAERLRSQHWLTYERNEWILASALRLAAEMERSVDTSESTITHHASEPSKEIAVKTHHATLDRSATAARFLSLAYRINMDQLKLTQLQHQLPELDKLPSDHPRPDFPTLADLDESEPAEPEPTEPDRAEPTATEPSEAAAALPVAPNPKSQIRNPQSEIASPQSPICNQITTINLCPSAPPVHKTHEPQPGNSSVTFYPATSYAEISDAGASSVHACNPPSTPARPARSITPSSPQGTPKKEDPAAAIP